MTWCVTILNLHQPDDMSELCLLTIMYVHIMYMGCGRGSNVDREPMYTGCRRGWIRHWSTMIMDDCGSG